MSETYIPLAHIQTWISILAIFITVFIATASGAMVVVRLFIKPIIRDLEAMKEARKERGEQIEKIKKVIFPEEAHNRLVTDEICRRCQSDCFQRVHDSIRASTDAVASMAVSLASTNNSLCDIRIFMARIAEKLGIPYSDGGGR